MSPKLLDEFDFGPATNQEKYNYNKILDGQIWQLFPDEDFSGKPQSFAQSVYSAARRRGFKARVKVMPDGSVVLQAKLDQPATSKQ